MPAKCDPLIRLWYYVTPDEHGCWVWHGNKNRFGYGLIRVGAKQRSTHRFAFASLVREPDPAMDIMHTCDNRACVNSAHLVEGTTKQNIHDMIAKGRANLRGKALRNELSGKCASGRHDWVPENIKQHGKSRRCKVCTRERAMSRHRETYVWKRGPHKNPRPLRPVSELA